MSTFTKKQIEAMFDGAQRKFHSASKSNLAAVQDLADGLEKLTKSQHEAFNTLMRRLDAIARTKA